MFHLGDDVEGDCRRHTEIEVGIATPPHCLTLQLVAAHAIRFALKGEVAWRDAGIHVLQLLHVQEDLHGLQLLPQIGHLSLLGQLHVFTLTLDLVLQFGLEL